MKSKSSGTTWKLVMHLGLAQLIYKFQAIFSGAWLLLLEALWCLALTPFGFKTDLPKFKILFLEFLKLSS